MNLDSRNATSATVTFVKKFFYNLYLFKNHIRKYQYRYYAKSDLPAIIGYVPSKTRKMIAQSPGTIVISALGFGEILISVDLIKKIKSLYSYPIVILSRQPQVARRMHQSRGSSVTAFPYPFFAGRPMISHWLGKLRPSLILCIESMVELRAEMLELAKERYKTSVLLVNAHAFRPSTFLLHVLEDTKGENKRRFRCLDLAGVVSEEAGKYLLGNGVPGGNVVMVNNLKFDVAKETAQTEESAMLRRRLGISGDARVLICGSVHFGEEVIILKAFQDLIGRPGLENVRLIIAPRELYDVSRMTASIKSLGFSVVLRTACSSGPHDSSAVIIVDTLGELKTLYSIADVVVVAGSMLSDLFGHNPIEPAILGKPVIVGPYAPSFKDVMDKFLNRDAIIQLQHTEELADRIAFLFEHPEIRGRMGSHARTIVEECGGATEKYLDMIGRLLPRSFMGS